MYIYACYYIYRSNDCRYQYPDARANPVGNHAFLRGVDLGELNVQRVWDARGRASCCKHIGCWSAAKFDQLWRVRVYPRYTRDKHLSGSHTNQSSDCES